jgi:three-Cys-motif partner protein
MNNEAAYEGREATLVKHTILKLYVEALAYKVGSVFPRITYVDGFAGPWKSSMENLSDTSPHIALKQLNVAREGLGRIGRFPEMSCIFIEKDPLLARQLEDSLLKSGRVQTTVITGEFEDHVADVTESLDAASDNFSFVFIDPTGWTGFTMDKIIPILKRRNGEVLINFMTKDIKRFIDDESSTARRSFERLYGSSDYREQWRGLRDAEREDAMVDAYCRRVQDVGGFAFVVRAVVLHPRQARTHFHLIYATRSIHGLRAFRDAERKAMQKQEEVRARAQQQKRIRRSGQGELIPAVDLGADDYYSQLRDRYSEAAKQAVLDAIRQSGTLMYDDIEAEALLHPMTWQQDVKGWLKEWKADGRIRIEGLGPRERVPKLDSSHRIVWTS